MTFRVTEYEVRELIGDPELCNLQPFMAMANVIVNDLLMECTGLSADVAALIEKNIAAHFVTANSGDNTITSEDYRSVKISYQTLKGWGLNSTTYGVAAMMLDPCGVLVRANDGNTKKRFYIDVSDY